jgi:hypothetical protein
VGSRSKARARAQVSEAPKPEPAQPVARPKTLTWAAAIQAVEAAGVLLASVLAGVDAARGQSYRVNSGIALTVIGLACAIALGCVALGIVRLKAWSRTPAVITQLFCVFISVYLLQAHRYAWGVPGILLGLAGLVALFVPQSFRALSSLPPEPPGGGNG